MLWKILVINIEIGNSYSKITGLSAKQENKVKTALSYTIGGSSAYFSGHGIRRKSLLDKKGSFPTGLLHRILEFLYGNALDFTANDNRIKPGRRIPMPIASKLGPYDSQYEATDAATAIGRGIISMPTGTGKSFVIALIAARLNVKTLVVVPSLEIKKQLTDSITEFLGHHHKVTVENIDSKMLDYYGLGYDCLIIDEAHHVAAKTYQKLNKTMWQPIYYRFFLTATPFRNDTEESLLFRSIAGEVIFRLDYKTAVEKGYIVPVEAYYIELPKQKTNAYTWAEVYKELVVNNISRNTIIFNILYGLYESGKSTLCLVKEVNHGKNIKYPSFVSGADDESRQLIEKFNTGEIKCLVGTEGIIGEGVDTKPCEYVILAGLGKAKSRIMQAIGRGVRKYPGKESCKVILIKDKSHKFCLRHFNIQCKILKDEYGVIPVKLEVK